MSVFEKKENPRPEWLRIYNQTVPNPSSLMTPHEMSIGNTGAISRLWF